jgi:arylsulfatase A-like enzyme
LAPPPNLVLITVDTLRADHLGCYGYSRPASPRIDHLAESGLVFERAISQAPWTLPSIATLFTSLYPREHGAIGARTPLKRELTTLSETLQAAGYGTTAVVSHWFVGRRYGLDQGFDTFDQTLARGEDGVTSPDLTKRALQYLGNVAGEPYFLWVHYFDPHFTYVRHPEFGFVDDPNGLAPARLTNIELRDAEPALADDAVPNPFSVDTVRAIYDEEIAYTDAAIGNLVDGITGMNFRRPTVTVFTADHGEYFMERGRFGHGRDVYDELVHVPLIVWGSIEEQLQGLRIARTVEIASVAHTLAELAQVGDNPFQGEDLLAVPETSRRTRPSFSEGNYAWGADERKIMVEWEGWKLIRNLDDDRFELYDLSRDPRERENRWDQKTTSREVAHTALHEALDRFARRQAVQAPSIILSPDEIERLNALGYVEN